MPDTTISPLRGIPPVVRALLASDHYHVHAKVHAENGAGEIVNYGLFGAANWFRSARWTESVDQPIASGSIELWREMDGLSLAPLMYASTLNRNAAGEYSPALNSGRRVELYCQITPPGVAPIEDGWLPLLVGKVDLVDWKGSDAVVTLNFRDPGAWLIDTQIKDETTYENEDETAMPIADLSQRIIDDWPVKGAPTLYVAGDPDWHIKKHVQKKHVSVYDALKELWDQIGWVVRYRWTADGYVLVAYEPDRDIVEPHIVFTPQEYLEVLAADLNDANVRNDLRLPYQNDLGQEQPPITRVDPVSQAEFGNRYMEFKPGSASNITTPAEANRLLDAVASDLGTIEFTHSIKLRFNPWIGLGDYCGYAPNGVHYDEEQRAAVQTLSQELVGGGGWTVIGGSGKPRGAYATWLYRGVRGGESEIPDVPPFVPVIQARLLSSSAVENVYRISAAAPSGELVSLFTAVGNEAFPEIPGANPVDITLSRATADAQQRSLRIFAVSASGGTDFDTITIDYDFTPGFNYVNRPEPLLSQNEQIGHTQAGSADDDTRGAYIVIRAGTVDFAGASVPWLVVEGRLWLDLSETQLFAVSYLQDAGRAADVDIFPTEFYGPDLVAPGSTFAATLAAAGAVGPVFTQRLARAPITEVFIRPGSSSTRILEFTVNPAGSTLKYRVGGDTGQWVTIPNAVSAQHTIDVSVVNVLVEFYSISVAGEVEGLRRMNIDQNNEPNIDTEESSFREIRPNIIGQVLVLDDDALTWETWGRPGESPLDRSGTPVERYFQGRGSRQDPDMEWWAENGTWYIVVRARDFSGAFTQAEFECEVSGTAIALGYLSLVRARTLEEPAASGEWYNDVLFNSSEQIDTDVVGGVPAYTVDVKENGVFVAVGRDARLDHDGATLVANEGGWHIRKAHATPGQVYSGQLTFTYDVILKHNGSAVATYRATLLDHYVGDGLWEEEPDEDPLFVAITLEPLPNRLEAEWTMAPDVRWISDIQWQDRMDGAAWGGTWFGIEEVGREANTYTYPNPWMGTSGRWYRARVRWRSNGGWGEWVISNEVFVGDEGGGL